MSTIALIALTLGSYSSAGASAEPAPQTAVTTYFISTTGNDANAGTSAAPFKTIQKCANVAGAGAVCNVAAGTYAERVTVSRAGIVFQANGVVTIKGFTLSSTNTTVAGFYILNADVNAGGVAVSGSSNIVKNNRIEGACMAGIIMTGSNNLAENNDISKSRQCGGSGPDADGIRMFADGNIARGNYIHDISKTAYPTAHIDCVQSWGTLTNAIIENNVCNVADAGVQTDVGNVHNIIIRNNVFVAARPLNMRGEGLKITNNVLVGNATSAFVLLQSSSNVTFQNNIIYNTSDGFLTSVGSVTAGGYNIFYNASGTAPRRDSGYSYVNNQVKWPTDKWQTVNPLFVNPGAGDYHLKSGSLAIDAGLGGVDIGAFASDGSPAATATVMATVTPSVVSTATLPMSITPIASSPTATMSVPASATPTASSVPVVPTSTSVSSTATAVPVMPTSTTAVQPTATVQQQNPPAQETTYDNKHSSFVYSSDWRDVKIAAASGGSFKKTKEDGSSVTFTFTGQSFSVLYTSGPNFGKINVYVDNVLVGTISQNGSKTVYQKRWDYSGQLTLGTHKLKLVVANPNGSIDAVIVR